jgi:very-short-patch-repair endonuclease
MHFNNLKRVEKRRKELRNHLTSAEARMWTYLQYSKLDGRKFRRQHSVGAYILDFYCPSERLCVELDGAIHLTQSARVHDATREKFLASLNIRVIRFENRLVFENPDGVLAEIRRNFKKPPLPPP